MKSTQLTKATKEVIDLKERAIDKVMADLIEPLEKLGSPEELIAKPYESWQPQDLALLSKIYGTGNDTVLANLIFRKEFEKVTNLEKEVGG